MFCTGKSRLFFAYPQKPLWLTFLRHYKTVGLIVWCLAYVFFEISLLRLKLNYWGTLPVLCMQDKPIWMRVLILTVLWWRWTVLSYNYTEVLTGIWWMWTVVSYNYIQLNICRILKYFYAFIISLNHLCFYVEDKIVRWRGLWCLMKYIYFTVH